MVHQEPLVLLPHKNKRKWSFTFPDVDPPSRLLIIIPPPPPKEKKKSKQRFLAELRLIRPFFEQAWLAEEARLLSALLGGHDPPPATNKQLVMLPDANK